MLNTVTINGRGGIEHLQYEAGFVNTTRTQGNLVWYNSFGKAIGRYPAVSGSRNPKKYPIPEGNWTAPWLNTQPNPKFTRHDVSFRITLGADRYDPLRGRETGLIRIHPARSMGTEVCIGLIGDKSNIIDFYDRYSKYYHTHGTMLVNVIYTK